MTVAEKKKLSVLLFYEMLRIRRIEEAIAERYPEQEMRCPVHLSIGQEAIAVGVCHNLRSTDQIFSNHRAHAHYLAKGGNFPKMLAEIYGKETGCCRGRGGSMHLTDLEAGMVASTPIVGSSIPVAVGSAFAAKMRGEEKIVVIFLGEGATEEGVFSESINFTALKNLPVLFVCENNFYSVYSPMNVRVPEKRDRLALVEAHGIPAIDGEGNDILEVYQLSKKAVAHVREKGPFFLEFSTYRFREHCGPNVDDALGYRTEEEVSYWQQRDPIKQAIVDELVTKEELHQMEKSVAEEIEEAFAFAKTSPFPLFHEQKEAVYASHH